MGDGTDIRRLLGVDQRLTPVQAAITIARTIPVRGDSPQEGDLESELQELGGLSAASCAETLATLCGATRHEGEAFSGRWPWIALGTKVLAPGIPVAVSTGEEPGPDGVYRRHDHTILREAVGREQVLIDLEPRGRPGRPKVDLLWFGSNARFVVHGGEVHVEDLFSKTQLTARRRDIERWLVRELRHPPEILDGIEFQEQDETEQSLEVSRPAAITDPSWADPQAFFGVREDVASVETRGSRLVLQTVAEEKVVLWWTEEAGGWTACRHEGPYIFEEISVRCVGDEIRVRIIPEIGRDLASPALRARLTFDLSSDLVSLARPQIS